jgi:chromosome segregation protein
MTDGFDENVPNKMPTTRRQPAPKRPWDVKPADVKPVAEQKGEKKVEVAEPPIEVRSRPMKAVETKEDQKQRVKMILQELTEAQQAAATTEPAPERPRAPRVIERPPVTRDVLTATDNSMLIEEESRDVLSEIDSLEAEIESTISMQNQVEDELKRVRDEYDELLGAKEELEARIETLKTVEELESNLKAAEEENRLVTERVGELDAALQDREAQIEHLRSDLSATASHLQDTTRERDSLLQDLEQSMQEIEHLQQNVSSLQEVRKEANSTIKNLQGEREDLAEKVEDLSHAKAQADANIEQLEKELAEERQKTKYLETSVENYAVVKATLESDLNAARSALKGIRERLAQAALKFKKAENE